jgi:hypothetical protein
MRWQLFLLTVVGSAPARFADKFFKGIEEQLSKQTRESH